MSEPLHFRMPSTRTRSVLDSLVERQGQACKRRDELYDELRRCDDPDREDELRDLLEDAFREIDEYTDYMTQAIRKDDFSPSVDEDDENNSI